MDKLYFHSGNLAPLPEAECTARNYGPHEFLPKTNADNPTDGEKEIHTDGHIISTGPYRGPPYPIVVKCIKTLDTHTRNEYKCKKSL